MWTPDSGHHHTEYNPQNKQANIITPSFTDTLYLYHGVPIPHDNQHSSRSSPFLSVKIRNLRVSCLNTFILFKHTPTNTHFNHSLHLMSQESTHTARCRKTDSISCHITLHITHNINNQLNTIIHACKLSSYSFILYFLVPISQPHRLIIIIKSNQTWKYLFKRPMYTYIQATFHFILTLDSKMYSPFQVYNSS